MRKYNLRCNYCGHDDYHNYFFLILKLLLKGEIYHHCKVCHKLSRYRLVAHLAHDSNTKEKQFNKDLKENKRVLWGKC